MHIRDHYRETADLIAKVPPDTIANWLLNEGYFPEAYVLPPSFSCTGVALRSAPYYPDLGDLVRKQLEPISYPKTDLTQRVFAVMHPHVYHDIVFHLHANWAAVLDRLFNVEQRVHSYSFPLPVSGSNPGRLGTLRAGRMIYEWLAMAEKDLVLDAARFSHIARTDIANFYGSIYTHSIAWALHGREAALRDQRERALFGSKIDRLLQYADDGRTNGIPVGPALSDLIAEILLSAVDLDLSLRLPKNNDAVAVRFKDDYRILCRDEDQAREFLHHLSAALTTYNLQLNELKTCVNRLPGGLYRKHDREYFPHSLRSRRHISFRTFEHTLLIALDIHAANPGTSILEKFLAELLDNRQRLKLRFASSPVRRTTDVKKCMQLLFFAKRASPKTLCYVLALCQLLYRDHIKDCRDLRAYLRDAVLHEAVEASKQGSVFEVAWYVYFSRLVDLGLGSFDGVESPEVRGNAFVKSLFASKQRIFADSGLGLFRKPRELTGTTLAEQVAVFGAK